MYVQQAYIMPMSMTGDYVARELELLVPKIEALQRQNVAYREALRQIRDCDIPDPIHRAEERAVIAARALAKADGK